MSQDTYPRFADLPERHGARAAWGLFGSEDSIGRFNLIGPGDVAGAAALVHDGSVFPLDLPLDYLSRSAHRTPPAHSFHPRGPENYAGMMMHIDDVLDAFNTQCATHWDSLGHASATATTFYNGASEDDVLSGRRNTIDHWSRRGIAGRGVLVDIARLHRERGTHYDVAEAPRVTVGDLADALDLGGLNVRRGDIVCINFGFLDWHATLERGVEAEVMSRRPPRFVGLESSEEMAQWLWDSGAAAIACDAPGMEAFPAEFDRPYGSLHRVLIGLLGFPIGEFFDLRRLARACEADGRYDFLFTSSPLHIPAGLGAPANALALR